MFKDLKIIKLVVIASFFVFILQSSLSEFKVSNTFVSKGSFNLNEKIEFYIAANYTEEAKKIEIKDLWGNILFDTLVHIEPNFELSKRSNILSAGYPVNQNYRIENAPIDKSGIYEVEGVPFVVKSDQVTDITIVYPFLNNHFFTKTDEGYFFNEKLTHLSLHRKVPIDEYTKGMSKQFAYLDSAYSTNYITDIDLADKTSFADSKLLIIYGNSSFWTTEMRENVLDFYRSEGSILIITSKIFHTKLWEHEKDNIYKTTRLNEELNKQTLEPWEIEPKESAFLNIALTYRYGGGSRNILNSSYKILKKNSLLFDNVAVDFIPVEGKSFMGSLINLENEPPAAVDLKSFENPNVSKLSVEILAYLECEGNYENSNSGIFIVKQDSVDGEIIALGTKDWCLKRNQENADIRQITRNSIKYLLGK